MKYQRECNSNLWLYFRKIIGAYIDIAAHLSFGYKPDSGDLSVSIVLGDYDLGTICSFRHWVLSKKIKCFHDQRQLSSVICIGYFDFDVIKYDNYAQIPLIPKTGQNFYIN